MTPDGALTLAFVVPRFGPDVHGGAELFGAWFAERVALAGHRVDLLTTCARDHRTWRNEYRPGTEQHGPLVVHRFRTDERDLPKHSELERAIVGGEVLSRDDELLWLRNGVSSSEMEAFIAAEHGRYDAVFVMPYLHGITYFTYRLLPERVVLVPCLHDEAYARTSVMTEMLRESRGLMFHTDPEREIATRIAGELAPSAVVGLGFDDRTIPDPAAARAKYGLDTPYLLYVGRREGGKGTPELIDYFRRFKARRPGGLRLVLVGSGDEPEPSADVVTLEIDWADRDEVMAGAAAFCQPSTNESLSIVLLQSWLAGTAAIVNGHCAVTRHHCTASNGGLWFTNYAEFEAVLDRILEAPGLAATLATNGRAYVEQEYGWPAVMRRFDDALQTWAVAAGART